MTFTNTGLPGVVLVEPSVFEDDRGFFMETYHRKHFTEAGITADFVQDNHSCSTRGVLRGIHYQIRHTQGKLVRAIVGEVFDVAVDLRRSSPCFGRWVGMHLSAENKRQLWVPAGFGHAFLVLSEVAEFAYKTTDYYSPQDERCVRWNDPDLGINWPMHIDFMLSERDRTAPKLRNAECFE